MNTQDDLTGNVEANNSSRSEDNDKRQVLDVLRRIYDQIPTTPAALEAKLLGPEPWYLHIGPNGECTVTVPSDIDSLADDPAAIVAVAAIMQLKANIRTGLSVAGKPEQWQRCDENVDEYWFGLAALLKVGTVGANPNYSGWFGRGYNFGIKLR